MLTTPQMIDQLKAHIDQELRNYIFSANSGPWSEKRWADVSAHLTVKLPFQFANDLFILLRHYYSLLPENPDVPVKPKGRVIRDKEQNSGL